MEPRRHFSFKRELRTAEVIRAELAQIFLRKVSDPRIHGLVITGVDINPETNEARVKVVRRMEGEFREPTVAEIKDTMKGLKSASAFIFEELRRGVSMKSVPWVVFQYDNNLAKTSSVLSILNQISKTEPTE